MLVGKNTSSVVWLCSLASHQGWQAPAEFVLALTLHKSMHCEGITDTLLHYEGCFELWNADKVSRSFVGLRRTLSITAVLHHWRWANCSETRDWLSTWWDIHRIMWQKCNFIKVCIKRDFTMEHFLHIGASDEEINLFRRKWKYQVQVSEPRSAQAFDFRKGKLRRKQAACCFTGPTLQTRSEQWCLSFLCAF